MEEKFLLRNVYSTKGVSHLAANIKAVYSEFDDKGFCSVVNSKLESLGFGDRGNLISNSLDRFLPKDFEKAANILLEALPPAGSEELKGYEGFIIIPQAGFISRNGMDYFDLSIKVLFEMTLRFSTENDIRPFLIRYPEKTIARLKELARHPHALGRRLASEGTRPRLPLCGRLDIFIKDPSPVLEILEILKDDPALVVRRSVANNLNDISKDNPEVVVETLTRWKKNASPEREWLINHSLRTLYKMGHPKALELQGYPVQTEISLNSFSISKKAISLGESLGLDFILENKGDSPVKLMIDYGVHFKKANGTNKLKVFKLSKKTLEPRQQIKFKKSVPFVPINTRVFYPGDHIIDLRVNGNVLGSCNFHLSL